MTYDKILISDLEIMSAAKNYRNWMYRQLAPFIGQRVIEIGAGIGNFTKMLLDRELVVATDNYPACVKYLTEHLGEQLQATPVFMDISGDVAPELRGYEFDTVICLNVLEHIEDDVQALSQMRSLLQSGGRLVLLVPAFQFLYGTVDMALGHHRRYRRKDLLPRIQRAGFLVEHSFYMNAVGMAGWFWNNRVVKKSAESPKQIGIFDRYIAPCAEFVEKLVPPPAGLSLIAVGSKY